MLRNIVKIPRSMVSISRRSCSGYSGMISYSGGQANESGQGGYYASGGARLSQKKPSHNLEAVPRNAEDIIKLSQIMDEVAMMENELSGYGTAVNAKTIELKSKIRKAIHNPVVNELLNRLNIKGEPVWGLSSRERELVKSAYRKYNS